MACLGSLSHYGTPVPMDATKNLTERIAYAKKHAISRQLLLRSVHYIWAFGRLQFLRGFCFTPCL